jgi:hypothetical protein
MGEGIFSKIGKPPGLSNKITLNGGADGLFVFLFLSFFARHSDGGPQRRREGGPGAWGKLHLRKGEAEPSARFALRGSREH